MTTATARRVAPTARLLLPANADRDLWLAARRNCVGSSDVARILGLYPSPLRVYYDKRGELPDTDSPLKYWGRRFETDIADEWTRRNRTVTRRIGLVAHVDEPWRACTMDRRVLECPLTPGLRNACSLECKATSVFRAHRWRRQVPDDVLAQGLHQIRVTGDDHQHVAVLVLGDNDPYRQYVIWRDRELDVYDFVAEQVDAFHSRHMGPDAVAPDSVDPDLPDELYPHRDGVRHLNVDEAVEAFAAREDYLAAHVDLTQAKARKNEARGRLLAAAGDAEVVVAGGDLLLTYLEQAAAPRVDLDQLAERWPEAYAACVQAASHRTLSIAGARARTRRP